jgi:hypothetical protein
MKHPSTAAATATLYQRCVNVDKLKYLPLEESGFHFKYRIPHKKPLILEKLERFCKLENILAKRVVFTVVVQIRPFK